MTSIAKACDWLETPEVLNGEWQGEAQGAGISMIVNRIDRAGAGPRLHRHPYAETFLIRLGQALFTVGDERIRGTAGDILVVPPDTPHKFENVGSGRLETIDIHENGAFITEWLE
jgi:mannose-6-phosphate isomerase-like protein (cupin superfamily)